MECALGARFWICLAGINDAQNIRSASDPGLKKGVMSAKPIAGEPVPKAIGTTCIPVDLWGECDRHGMHLKRQVAKHVPAPLRR